eukprot:SAG11_NODE_318_length_10823_cov_79.807068_3_plen_311_part_00
MEDSVVSAVSLETLAKTPLNKTSLQKKGTGRLLFWELIERTRNIMQRNLPDISYLKNYSKGTLLVCGGAPSLANELKTIKKLTKTSKVLTCNKTHDYFLKHKIVSDYCCLLDPKEWVADYVKKRHKKTKYLVAGQCHPKVFDKLKKANVVLWHAGVDYYGEEYPTKILANEFSDKDWQIIAGGTTVGLRSILVGYLMGYRDFRLFGFDSSLTDDKAHAYDKPKPYDAKEGEIMLQSKLGNEKFLTNSHMAKQCLDFEHMLEKIGGFIRTKKFDPINIQVYGTGLLPSLAAGYGLHSDPKMNMKWCGREAA